MITFRGLSMAFLSVIPGFYVPVVLAMYLYQERLQFHPDTARVDPASIGLFNAEEIALATADAEALVAWYTPAHPSMPTILFLHGNGGSIGRRPERYQYFTSRGFGLLYLSWRGYGGSTGRPSENGFMIDAQTAYDWLRAKGIAPSNIAVIGESIGTGIAVKLAAKNQTAALALEAPYSSAADVAANQYWWLPVRMLMRNPIDAAAVIASVEVPLLVQHGGADITIPIEFSRKLFAAANEPKEFVEIPGADHFIFNEETFAREAAFFRKVLNLPQ